MLTWKTKAVKLAEAALTLPAPADEDFLTTADHALFFGMIPSLVQEGTRPGIWLNDLKALFEITAGDIHADTFRYPVAKAEDLRSPDPAIADRAILLAALHWVHLNNQSTYDAINQIKAFASEDVQRLLGELYNPIERASASLAERNKKEVAEQRKQVGIPSNAQLKAMAKHDTRLRENALKLQAEEGLQYAEAIRKLVAADPAYA
ncbi:hypothetical protein [Deinococcus ficus]|uniref:Uncharacterized protein n=1 Tax=Deinococcus ficus TaxID=317577 RepID=A0A221T300_9DEIO|nr:hypothetical protein [Deinococcus ficus]ASN83278.1 hypothetical protein DFI_18950 [Deinococcus ficus]